MYISLVRAFRPIVVDWIFQLGEEAETLKPLHEAVDVIPSVGITSI